MDILVQNIKQSKESILEKFIETRPQNVDLSDEDVMEEIRAFRYKISGQSRTCN